MKRQDKILILLVITVTFILSVSFVAARIDNIRINRLEGNGKTTSDDELGGDNTPEIPPSINGLLVGFDATNGLTDVLMIGALNTETNKIKVISVPRDLVIDFRDELFKDIKKNNPNNRILYCKLTEVYSLTGHNEKALNDLKEIISIITGLEIDYMASIDVNGFSQLIDVIGGVDFYVPERMYYRDPFQNLYIDLQEGMQFLDGDKAEQLVRYREYVEGDLQRIKVQQDLVVTLFDKIMSIKEFSTLKNLITTSYDIFKADFGLLVVLNYAEYFFNLDIKNLLSSENMVMIPSYGEKIDNIWYQRWDIDEAHKVVYDLINEIEEEHEEEHEEENQYE